MSHGDDHEDYRVLTSAGWFDGCEVAWTEDERQELLDFLLIEQKRKA